MRTRVFTVLTSLCQVCNVANILQFVCLALQLFDFRKQVTVLYKIRWEKPTQNLLVIIIRSVLRWLILNWSLAAWGLGEG